MLIPAIENFVLFSTVFAIAGFVVAFALRRVNATWDLRVGVLERLYTATIVIPPLAAVWLVAAVFLPQLWVSPQIIEAAHAAPYHQLHLLGELTITLEPTLSYAVALFVVATGLFAIWSNAAGAWRIGRVIRRLDMNASAPQAEQVALVNEIAERHGLAVGLVMTDYPLSFVWGLRRSKLILSSGLLRTLTTQELTGVLEHEAAHHQRRDNLLKLLLSFFTYSSLAFPLSRLILRWRATEVEAICDEAAVARTSAPLDLAEALVKLRRQTTIVHATPQPNATNAIVSGFVSGNSLTFEYRVSRLLTLFDSSPGLIESKNILSPNKIAWLFLTVPLLSLLGVFVFAPLSVHHAAETFIQILK